MRILKYRILPFLGMLVVSGILVLLSCGAEKLIRLVDYFAIDVFLFVIWVIFVAFAIVAFFASFKCLIEGIDED